jgi:hypothetical protein
MSSRNLSRPAPPSTQEFRLTRATLRHVRSGQVDEEIDKQAYIIYGLTNEEVKIIEGKADL